MLPLQKAEEFRAIKNAYLGKIVPVELLLKKFKLIF
jgi:hypothetical protein